MSARRRLNAPSKKLILILIAVVLAIILLSSRSIRRSLFGWLDKQRAERELTAIEQVIQSDGLVKKVAINSGTYLASRTLLTFSVEDREAIAANLYNRPGISMDEFYNMYFKIRKHLEKRSGGRIDSDHIANYHWDEIRRDWGVKSISQTDRSECSTYIAPDNKGYQMCIMHFPEPVSNATLQIAGFQSTFASSEKPFNVAVTVETVSDESFFYRELMHPQHTL